MPRKHDFNNALARALRERYPDISEAESAKASEQLISEIAKTLEVDKYPAELMIGKDGRIDLTFAYTSDAMANTLAGIMRQRQLLR